MYVFFKTLVDAKSKNSNCNSPYTKYYPNTICVKYKYVEYKSNDINYNHPNALYPVKAITLYPIGSSNSSSNYTVKYKTVCYPYPVYYDLFLNNYNYSNYYKNYSNSYSNYNSYSKYSTYSKYSSYNNSSSSYYYSSYYYSGYNPYYLYEDYSNLKIEIKSIKYYDAQTGEFKESSF